MTTLDLYLGVINHGEENIPEITIAITATIIIGFFHRQINKMKLVELKSVIFVL
ncbi:MAG: hypothetical protein WCH34_10025 [Bacteroidota bacterium]